jgi:hypothetical protein
MSDTASTAAERLAAAQAAIAKAAADKEAALAAAHAQREATKAAKEAAKAAKAEARAAAAAAKAALPKRPVGRPRKNPLPADPESEDTDSGSIVTAVAITPEERITALEAELAETRARLAAMEAAYHREHATLMSIRALLPSS